MRLSAPIYRLKRHAKRICRDEGIPLNRALDRIAQAEGISSWSLLAARAAKVTPARDIIAGLSAGNMVLLAARPGHGKTILGIELLVETIRAGRRGIFFTLECTPADLVLHLKAMNAEAIAHDERFLFDDSDDIQADYIIDRLASAQAGSLAVVDYLQALDQRRENPDLMTQVRRLRAFARTRGIVLAFIAQVHRSYAASEGMCPGLDDVRLPNPLDLTLFDKACFLHDGTIRFENIG